MSTRTEDLERLAAQYAALSSQLTALKVQTDAVFALQEEMDATLAQLNAPSLPPEVKPPSCGPDYPAGMREVWCKNQNDVTRARDNAQPGDLIFLPDGDIDLGTVSRNGTAAQPIIFAASHPRQTRLRTDTKLFASYVGLLNMAIPERAVVLGSNLHNVGMGVRRCDFYGRRGNPEANGPILLPVNGQGAYIELTTIRDVQFVRGIWVNPEAGRGVIRRCGFLNFTGKSSHQTYEPVTIGEGSNTHTWRAEWVLETCLFDNCNVDTAESEGISVKSSNNIVTQCTFNNAGDCNLRFGNENRLEQVLVTGKGRINVHGRGHSFYRVEVRHNDGIKLVKGNWNSNNSGNPPPGSSNPSQHPNAISPVLTGCIATVRVGTPNGTNPTYRAINALLCDHTGEIINTQGGAKEWREEQADARYPAIPVITRDMIGPTYYG